MGARRGDTAGAPADHRRRQVLRLRHRQRRVDEQRPGDRAVVAGLEEGGDAAAGRARGRRALLRQHRARTPDAAGVEVSPARRQGHGDDPSRHRRRRLGTDRAAADAARLPSRHAQRQHQRPRLQLEPGRLEAGARVGLARSQGRLAARRRQRDRCSPHRARREGGDALRVAHGLAGPLADQRGHLVFRAQRLGQPLSLRPDDRRPQASDYQWRGPRHADRARRRKDAHAVVRRQWTREGARPVLHELLPRRARRAGGRPRRRR